MIRRADAGLDKGGTRRETRAERCWERGVRFAGGARGEVASNLNLSSHPSPSLFTDRDSRS